jgi:putative membrane-bound dehydrogenase-like protein
MNRQLFALIVALTFASGATADDFPKPIDTETDKTPVMPADQAAASFKLPEGFKVSVFASEPDVRNPIAMAWDAKGRLWIAENYTYAERSARFDLRHRDRVLIFEDKDNDGVHDKRTVFTEDVQMLTSVEVGLGGVWLMCPPQLLFVPDKDGDDKPDGAPTVVLDGFTVPAENYHNFANGLRWGPDGWLYGRCGASSPGMIGEPGTPNDDRIPINGGMWRYHPKSKRFEALNHGTTNPWGHDWDANGELFFINTVNGHLWHSIPGAHFVRPHTVDPNPRVYETIDQHADHFHWDTAKDWSDSRKPTPEHDRRGGGHAHSGVMIYQGDQWPKEYQGKLFTLNFHGRRMNVERLEREGSGFVGKHEPDRFFAGDTRFRGIDLSYGPDGGVYVLDWNDSGECHENTGVHRNSGRIYKFTYGNPTPPKVVDLSGADTNTLIALLDQDNEWYARMARRVLADRVGDRGDGFASAFLGLRLDQGSLPLRSKLQMLWTLHALGNREWQFTWTRLAKFLRADDEALRTWAIRLLADDWPLDTVTSRRPRRGSQFPDEILAEFARMAKEDKSGLVRLTLASTLQRLPVAQRAALAAPLLAHKEDANDHNLPLMIWYGLIPVADSDPSALAKMAGDCALPTTRRFIARRLAEELDKRPGPVGELIAKVAASPDPAFQLDILQGLSEGLRGWRKAPRPSGWESLASNLSTSGNDAIKSRVRDLGVLFGDGRALDDMRKLALDDKAELETRRAALKSLIDDKPADLRSICEKLLKVRFLNTTAVRGLALFDDPSIGQSLAKSYKSFHPSERAAVIDTLASRVSFARALLEQVASGQIPRGDVTAFQARQIRSLGDSALSTKLAEAWGELRDSPLEKKEAIAKLKSRLTPEGLASGVSGQGRVLYNKLCASCHTLYGHGGAIGPDLTGSGRDNLDYLLENLLDPSASVNADFKMAVVSMNDGRVLNGLVRAPTERTITLQSQNEAVVLSRKEIEEIKPSPLSLMPEGQLDSLTPEEVRDLFAYLMKKTQVPLPDGSK